MPTSRYCFPPTKRNARHETRTHTAAHPYRAPQSGSTRWDFVQPFGPSRLCNPEFGHSRREPRGAAHDAVGKAQGTMPRSQTRLNPRRPYVHILEGPESHGRGSPQRDRSEKRPSLPLRCPSGRPSASWPPTRGRIRSAVRQDKSLSFSPFFFSGKSLLNPRTRRKIKYLYNLVCLTYLR